MATRRNLPRPGRRLIFRPWITHPKTKQRIYPKNGRFFPIWVKCVQGQSPNVGDN